MSKPVVISFLNQKGGTGKTTLATNIAHGLKLKGYNVLIVDADPQGSARDWNELNGGTLVPVVGLDRESLPKDLEAVKGGYDVVIIDPAGRGSKLTAAVVKASDVVLIPVQPSQYDINAAAPIIELINARQAVALGSPKAAFIISRIIKNTLISKKAGPTLQGYEVPVLEGATSQRVIYAELTTHGGTVYSARHKEAAAEIDGLVNELVRRYL